MSEETWRTLYAYYDLEVSNYGRFRKISTGSYRKPTLNKGSLVMSVLDAETMQQQQMVAHRLVWEAFRGPVPPMHCIRHRMGDPRDIRLDNLYCQSYSDLVSENWQGKKEEWRQTAFEIEGF